MGLRAWILWNNISRGNWVADYGLGLFDEISGFHGDDYEDELWNVAPGGPADTDRSFKGDYCHHHHNQCNNPSKSIGLHGATSQETIGLTRLTTGFGEHSNEYSGSIKDGGIFDKLSSC
jgi:hypothetical protein